jgi:glycosyltransferase involved in cell wall biosynthesis
LPYRLEQSPILAALVFSHAYKNVAPSNYLKIAFEKRDFSSIYIPNILEIKNYIYKERTRIQPKILWVRAFKYLYNPSMAIAVLQLVKKEFPEAKLCMVGPQMDASFEASKNLTKQYGLEKSVVFTGVLEKEKWLHKATDYDVFINTTNFDNTPVSVMEAMALGLTIVSTDAGGMPYLIDDQVDGVLVGKDEHHKMAAAIIKLIKECNTSYAKKARIKAESFGWNVVREQWKSILV